MKKHYRHENNCLNCGSILEGKFCHNCGQENLEIKESFGHMMNHAISDYFHFDHQFFHTLKPLLFKPGYLTNEYMAGRRVQYLHPVKMYIFISLVYFLLLFQQKNELIKIEHKDMSTKELNQAVKAITDNSYIPLKAKKEALADLYKDNGYIIVNNKAIKDTSKKAKAKRDEEATKQSLVNTTTKDTTYTQYLASQQKLPGAKRDGWLERYYNKKAFAINKQKINIKEVIEDGLKHNFPKMMFVLLPLFALILMITFRRSNKFYVEHLIYSFHLHCFIFLFLAMIMILKLIIPSNWDTLANWLNFVVVVAIIWYIYKSLRAVYHRNAWRTITKMMGMSITYSVTFGICWLLLLLITIVTAV
ncbi:MAG: hypothetical protein JWQ63_3962 [Mucilaginibacter sp.]|nr:hypothetical protein [Mucilaginibacter sp.]